MTSHLEKTANASKISIEVKDVIQQNAQLLNSYGQDGDSGDYSKENGTKVTCI
ncbi:hypothetical protein [Nostoc sp. PA-18-2419]|uniref:hypothetical protein n=1 Tax=Nostoc sp. PA-18-2419 TaxID=2575443 RepID=UPI00167528C0|nr:hypothetical protein [Nostoc sp. PA-18-2419]